MFLVAVFRQMARKEVCDCFGELGGWRTYWHDYCRTRPSATPPQLPPLFCLALDFSFSSSSKMEETTAAVVGFYPAFFTALLYQTTLSTSLQFCLSLSSPSRRTHPSMPRVQSALTTLASPSLPPSLHWLQQCHTRIRSHKGRRRKRLVSPTTAASMHCITI